MDFTQPLTRGVLLRRLNRFTAEVVVHDGVALAHVPNTGRLQELLVEGAPVYLTPVTGNKRKTNWDLTLVEKNDVLCAVDTRLPARLLREPEIGRVLGWGSDVVLKLEAGYGNHRFDLLVQDKQGRLWVEAKTVTLVVERHGFFPDAPTVRGTSHVRTLGEIAAAGNRTAVLFLALRPDVDVVHPNTATDPAFAAALRRAAEVGVMLRAVRYRITPQGVYFDQEIPVTL